MAKSSSPRRCICCHGQGWIGVPAHWPVTEDLARRIFHMKNGWFRVNCLACHGKGVISSDNQRPGAPGFIALARGDRSPSEQG
jgi:hypothetical protein